jgi:nucleosome binding factor SPN SPT16 subunit
MKIDLNMMIVEWVMTLFTRIFQLDSILNIWDIIFAHKATPAIIEEVCVAIITAHQKEILELTDAATVGKLLRSTKLAFE